MQKHTGTRWNYFMIALAVTALLAVGVFFHRAGTAILAAETVAKAQPSASLTTRPHKCGNVNVDVDFGYDNLVDPETFTACQDRGSGGHFMVVWKADHTKVDNFHVKFENVTPLVNSQGDDLFTLDSNPGGTTTGSAHTKNLALGDKDFRYFKYEIRVCHDQAQTDCEIQDPGGIIVNDK